MSKHSIIGSTLISATLVLTALPAGAASYAGNYSVSRYNTAGTSYKNMTYSSSTHCFLTTVGAREIDTGSESSTCRAYRGPIVWTLEATLGASSDQDVWCSAYCYNNW